MIGFREQHSDHQLLPGLPGLSELVGDVRHMCPENCVMPDGGLQVAKLFCPVCLGTGSITTERLDRWQAEQSIRAAKGMV
jgi:hypothetical protein